MSAQKLSLKSSETPQFSQQEVRRDIFICMAQHENPQSWKKMTHWRMMRKVQPPRPKIGG